MKRAAVLVVLRLAGVAWQERPASVEQGTLRLHYVQKPIGTERYEIVKTPGDGGLQLTADFDFTDRGGRVQLAATLRTAADLTPVHFQREGKKLSLRECRLRDRHHPVRRAPSARRRAEATVRADGGETRVTLPRAVLYRRRLRAVRARRC